MKRYVYLLYECGDFQGVYSSLTKACVAMEMLMIEDGKRFRDFEETTKECGLPGEVFTWAHRNEPIGYSISKEILNERLSLIF